MHYFKLWHTMLASLILACLRVSTAVDQAADENQLQILLGGTADFTCVYNPAIDDSNNQDLAVSVQNCSLRQDIVLKASAVTELAVVLGRQTFGIGAYKEVFEHDTDSLKPPIARLNQKHPLVTGNIAHLAHGNETVISVGIRGDPSVQSLCATCNQAGETRTYTETRRSVIRVVSPPTAQITFNGGSPLPQGVAGARSVNEGDPALIECSGQAEGSTLFTIRKSHRLLASSSSITKANYSVAAVSLADAGVYQCHVISDLPILAKSGLESALANFTLNVLFAPKFELDEVVRFTPIKRMEEVLIKVSAYPEPTLACQSTANELGSSITDGPVVRQSYDGSEYYATFLVAFSNLDEVKNETEVTCVAENAIGRREVKIRLTALAPVPQIDSDQRTNWWNSYHITWQHHVKANVDFYRIKIVYLSTDDSVVNQTVQAIENPQKTDDPAAGVSRGKGLVFNLNPNSKHQISLQACNSHGCSAFSDSVKVHTARKGDETFNNPMNPVYAKPQSSDPQNSAPPMPVLSVALMLPAGGLLARFPW